MNQSEKMSKVVEALDDLAIPWLLFTDSDSSGANALTYLVDPKSGEKLSWNSPQVVRSGPKQMEALLVDAGYQDQIEAVARDSGYGVTNGFNHLRFLVRNKSWAPELVARKAIKAGLSPPVAVVGLAQRIREVLDLPESGTSGKKGD